MHARRWLKDFEGTVLSRLDVHEIEKTLSGAQAGASAVLRAVTFSISDGECLGLKGSTGSGKTTLLRIIAGLLAPDSGEILLDDRLISSAKTQLPPAQRGIALVFQSLGLWPHLTVKGHLDFVLSATGLSRAEQEAHCANALETFLIRDLASRYPAQLSGGERHLLALARAFCTQTRLLLLDEPFTGLDSGLKSRVLETLAQERLRRNLTTLLVTHNDDEMRCLCDRVEHLSEGHIVTRSRKVQNTE